MRVGTSFLLCQFLLVYEDHPHACGDKNGLLIRLLSQVGSSPCVWGQVLADEGVHGVVGIIPMRVGTSLRTCR